jgi:hypothetical protein
MVVLFWVSLIAAQTKPEMGKVVFVYTKQAIAHVPFDVVVDGKKIAKMEGNTSLEVSMPVGMHSLVANSKKMALAIEVKGNERLYVRAVINTQSLSFGGQKYWEAIAPVQAEGDISRPQMRKMTSIEVH